MTDGAGSGTGAADRAAGASALDGDAVAEALAELYPFALSLTRQPDAAADLLQDAYVRAMERAGQFQGTGPLGAWLRRIVHHLAIDRGRRSARELLVDEVEERWHDDAYTVDAAVVAERAATLDELEDALVRLPFIYRSAVILHDVEGWTVREIADVHQLELPAAKARLRRGRMMLVSALAEGDERRAQLEGVPMRCWDARQHVSEYLNGDLDEDTAATVERHLVTCPTCPPLVASLVGVRDTLGGLRDPDSVIPPDLAARLRPAG